MFCVTRLLSNSNVSHLARTYARFIKRFKTDPGITQRKKIIRSTEELEKTDFDYLESDFMNVHKSHKEHVQEVEQLLEKEKFYIVRQKYFKEKYPNFLTWHDKEQIRYLHNSNPEEWTIDRLSEGFPALPDVIRRIIKSKWTKNPSRIANHDEGVQKNWETFKKGQLPDLPRDLVDHLNKFTNRSLNLKPFVIPENKKVVKVNNKNIGTDFSEIITSYEKLKNNNKSEDSNEKLNVSVNKKFANTSDDKGTYLTVKKKQMRDKRPVTLEQLQSNIETRALSGRVLSEEDKLLLQNLTKPSNTSDLVELNQEDISNIGKYKYESSTAMTKKTERDYSHLIYPEKIVIPEEHRKRGYTYKLNDCYYDHNGEFLYRVPGMD